MLSGLFGYNTIATTAINEEYFRIDDLPDYIQESYDFSSVSSISEIGSDDLYSITVSNDDGTYSTIQFFQPIKYFDTTDQAYKFIDNDIIISEDDNYAYENKANSFSTLFPHLSSDGVRLIDEKYAITMMPVASKEHEVSLVDNKVETDYISYGNVYGENTDLRYLTTNDGIKETLVLDEGANLYSYSFEISLNGVYVEACEGSQIEFKDSQSGESVFIMSPIYIQDSSEKDNITYNNYYNVEQLTDTTYKVSVCLDKEFLEDKDTVYPCVVDPTIYYMRAGTVDGVYATQSGNTMNNDYLQVGSFNGIGECISYLKITGLEDKKWVNPDNIINAKLALYDCSNGYYNSGTVTCYRSNSIISTSSAYYSQLNSAIGETIASVDVSNNNQYYQFNITTLLVNWIRNQIGQGGYSYNYGCIFKGSSSLIGRKAYKVDPDGGTTYKPYLEIKFTHDEPFKNGIYKISSAYNSRYIQYNGASSNVTAPSSTYTSIDKWKITNTGDGLYTIQPYNNESEYLYVSATTSGTYVSVSSTIFKWYITTNTNGTYRIFPANTINIANSLAYSGGNVRLYSYYNGTLRNWNISPVYAATVNNYYDMGYPVRYNESESISKSIINGYLDDVNDRYLEILGLSLSNNGTQYFNSIADTCKGTVTSSNINTLCAHSANHTAAMNIAYDFITYYQGTNVLTNVYWTGHRVTDSIGNNRSFSWGTNGIYMLELCSSSNREYNSKSVLMHELNHQYGAPDHYHEILDDGSCRGGIYCSTCGSSARPSTCIMCACRMDITDDNVICDGCRDQMIAHLEDHHVN